MKLTENFFNKAAEYIRPFFSDSNDEKYQKAKYELELFNNGCSDYNTLIKKLTLYCGTTQANIHSGIYMHGLVEDWEGFEFTPDFTVASYELWEAQAKLKEKAIVALQAKLKKIREEQEEEISDQEYLNLKRGVAFASQEDWEDANNQSYIDEIRLDGVMISARCEGDNWNQEVMDLEINHIITILEILEQDSDPEIL